jgi:MFS family permease
MGTGSSIGVRPALLRRAGAGLVERLSATAGGRERTKVVALLACVLGLEGADLATVGATAVQLEKALHISNAQVGMLSAIATLVGALATVPVGALTDRVRRVDLLAGSVALWAVAMVAGAAAQDFEWLLLSRIGLGAVTATAGPTLASLVGDSFPARERSRIYGYILVGELLGGGVGFFASGVIAGVLGWRWAFAILALPALALASAIWRHLDEPRRGGQSTLGSGNGGEAAQTEAQRAIIAGDVAPREALVLERDPQRMRLRDAVRYVLRIPTNRWLIVASAVGYFFFAGMRTFAVVFVQGHFGLSQASATALLFVVGLGTLAGVVIAGRLADRRLAEGRINARLVVAGVAYVAAAVLLLPSLLITTLAVAAPLLFLAGAALAAPNPPLDAARLDIMPGRLWGRAEGVRTLLRQTAQAGAPLLFGLLADVLGGAAVSAQGEVTAATTQGLQDAFLIMLVPLALNGILMLVARGGYATDVATAVASERAARARRSPSTARAS